MMGLLSLDHERLVQLIKESVSLLCKSSLPYDLELNVEGLLGITLDKKDIVLINIKESFQKENSKASPTKQHKQTVEEETSSQRKGKRNRKRSRERTESKGAESASVSALNESSGTETVHQPDVDSPEGLPDNVQMKEESEADYDAIVIKEEMNSDEENPGESEFDEEFFNAPSQYYPTYVFPNAGSGRDPGHGSQMNITDRADEVSRKRASRSESQPRHVQKKMNRGQPPQPSHVQKQESYPCEICGQVQMTVSGSARHRKTHSGFLKCKLCNKSFGVQSDLQRHELGVHKQ